MKEKKELIQYTAVCLLLLYLLCHYWDDRGRSRRLHPHSDSQLL